jgi:uncharacterized protein (TIGR03437 family)
MEAIKRDQLARRHPVSAAFDSSGFLPTTLGGIQVTIKSTPAPLLYVSDTQINAVSLVELASGASVSLMLANHLFTPLA